jgi:hypothetical protein
MDTITSLDLRDISSTIYSKSEKHMQKNTSAAAMKDRSLEHSARISAVRVSRFDADEPRAFSAANK